MREFFVSVFRIVLLFCFTFNNAYAAENISIDSKDILFPIISICLISMSLLVRRQQKLLEKLKKDYSLSTQLQHSILNMSPFGLTLKDANDNFKFVLCNKVFANMEGKSISEIVGHTDSEIELNTFNLEDCIALDIRAIESGKIITGTEAINIGNGEIRYLQVSKFPLFTKENGKYVVGIFIDITARRNIELKLQELLKNSDEQKKFFESLINTLPVHIFVKDANQQYRYLLSNAERNDFYGVKSDYFEGKTDFELKKTESPSDIRRRDEIATNSGELTEFDLTLMNSEGVPHHLKTVKKLYSNSNGERLLIGVSTDITETSILMEDEKLLRKMMSVFMSEGYFNATIKKFLEILRTRFSADDCWLGAVDESASTFTSFIEAGSSGNGSVSDYWATRKDYVLNKKWFDFLKSRNKIYAYDVESFFVDSDFWGKYCFKNGVKSVYATGIFANGKMVYILGMHFKKKSREFTDRDRKFLDAVEKMTDAAIVRQINHDQLVEALRKSRDAEKAKSYFIASVSHEIRTPLNALLGFTELLHDKNLNEAKRNEYLENVSYSGMALLKLINDVLDLSKIESSRMEYFPEIIDLSELIRDVCGVFGAKIKAKGIRMEESVENLPSLYVDRSRIRQVLFNFIGNAVKFTDVGKVKIIATFESKSNKIGTLRVEVSDSGRGISAADQKKLFEPFVQLHNLRGKNATNEGTGLGLAISRRMIEQMGGKVLISSKIGVGSVFGFELYNVAYDTIPQMKKEIVSVAPKKVADYSNLKVLIVDDVHMNLKVLVALLGKLGIKCDSAPSGNMALNLIGIKKYDYVLTDLWMPDMNGAELAANIRRKVDYKIKIVAITADVVSGQNFNMSTFDSVTTKPLSLEKLSLLFDSKV